MERTPHLAGSHRTDWSLASLGGLLTVPAARASSVQSLLTGGRLGPRCPPRLRLSPSQVRTDVLKPSSPGRASVPQEAATVLRQDDALAPLVERHGSLELTPAEDIFERFVLAIVRQQVSVAAADSIRERLFDRFDVTPDAILAADEESLRDVGLSAAKVEYVTAVAERFQEREYDHASFAESGDDEVITELTDIHGVGPWTAKMVLLFCLGREDVFPVEDLGIRRGMGIVVDPDLTRAAMCDRASEWAPYRSYASLYLWRAADG